jgi:hypothetical protein
MGPIKQSRADGELTAPLPSSTTVPRHLVDAAPSVRLIYPSCVAFESSSATQYRELSPIVPGSSVSTIRVAVSGEAAPPVPAHR